MKRKDFYLIGIAAAFALLSGIFFFGREEGAAAVVTQDGIKTGIYSLAKDQELTFTDRNGGQNVLRIENGSAFITEADCPDKLCVHQKSISKKGETIICLPHRLVIEVAGGEEGGMDAVTGR